MAGQTISMDFVKNCALFSVGKKKGFSHCVGRTDMSIAQLI